MQNFLRRIPKSFMLLVVLLMLVRIFLPTICLYIINKGLDEKLGTYVGRIEDFDLALYRGAYELQGLTIKKRNSDLPPFVTIQEINLSLAWRALFKKELAGDVIITNLVAQIADSKNKNQRQTGAEEDQKNWQDALGLLIPMSIESFRVRTSAVHFTNRDFKEPIPVSLEKIDLVATGIRTKAKNSESPFHLKAELQKHASLWLRGTWDLLSNPPRIDADFSLTEFRFNSVNTLLRSYIPIDITSGTLDIYGEGAMNKGRAKGYVKVFFKDGDIVAPKQKFISAKHFLIEIAVAFGNWLLKNNKTKKVSAEIPFEYNGQKLNVDGSDIFWSAVENSDGKLKPELNNSISLRSVSP